MRSRTATAGAILFHPSEFALSIAVELVVGGIGAAVLRLLTRQLQHPAPDPGAAATLPGASRTRRHRRPARRRLDPHLWVPKTRLSLLTWLLSADENRHDPPAALGLIYQTLTTLLGWLVLRARLWRRSWDRSADRTGAAGGSGTYRGAVRFEVTEVDTALVVGSGDVPVLATPRLIAWMEAATVQRAASFVGAGQTTVGTAVRIEHRRPTPVGDSVEIDAEAPDHAHGRRLTFVVRAVNGSGKVVAAGEIDRVIVDRDRFLGARAHPDTGH